MMSRNDWILLGLIATFIVMIAGFFFIAKIKADSGMVEYTNKNGDVFKLRSGKVFNTTFYSIDIFGGYNYQFRYSPADVENITVEKGVENLLNRPAGTEMIYITQDIDFLNRTDTNTILAISEFSRILGTNEYGIYKMNVKSAFTFASADNRTTVMTCANVSGTIAVIYVKEGEDRIYSDKGCLVIQGTKDSIIKAGDRFAYHLAGVIV